MNYSEQILKVRFEQLPEDIKEAIMATPWKEKLKQISEKHNLHIDQAGHLGEETVLVMFGIEHADNLITNIAKHAEVSEEKAEAIAEDLNREIFLKVRESLKKIFEEREEGEESSLLGGGLLGKTGEKAEEEMLNREDILREIEDKEHHNPPIVNAVNAPELHLEVSPPSGLAIKQPDEIMIPTENTHLETKRPSEISFQKPVTEKTQTEKPAEIITPAEQAQKKDLTSQTEVHLETKQSSPNNIIKDKMSGTVNIPKETIVIEDSPSPLKATRSNTEGKIDPYREAIK